MAEFPSFPGHCSQAGHHHGIHVVTRLMGPIIVGIAVEMIARGLGQLFPGLLGS